MSTFIDVTAEFNVINGLRKLAHILETAAIPGPEEIRHCIIAGNDTDGAAIIDRIGLELERAGIEHHVNDTDSCRELIIPLAKRLTYRFFYVYREAMAAYKRQQSYCDNIA